MLFDQFFPRLEGETVCVELKDGKRFTGRLAHLDMHYNVVLSDLAFGLYQNYGHVRDLQKVFIRGTAVKFIGLNGTDQALLDAAVEASRK